MKKRNTKNMKIPSGVISKKKGEWIVKGKKTAWSFDK